MASSDDVHQRSLRFTAVRLQSGRLERSVTRESVVSAVSSLRITAAGSLPVTVDCLKLDDGPCAQSGLFDLGAASW